MERTATHQRRRGPIAVSSLIRHAFGSKQPIEAAVFVLVKREYGKMLGPDELAEFLDQD